MAHPVRIRALDHVVLRVRDLDASLAFYVQVLGCEEERRLDDLGLVQLRAGASLIDLVPVSGQLGRAGGAAAGKEGRNVDHVALRIEELDAERLVAHLEAHGLAPSSIAVRYGAEGFGRSLYVSDPDGNVIELRGPPEQAPGDAG